MDFYVFALFAALIAVANGFAVVPSSRPSTALFGGAKGMATTLEGKQARIEFVKDKLSRSELIFSVPSEGLTVSESAALREAMPSGTTVSLIKNKLMSRAIEGQGEWEPAGELLKGTNMWFFVEEDVAGSLKAFKKFAKDFDKSESNAIKAGVMDSSVLDAAGVDAVGKLPSKSELYARIAGGINLVPTKLARVVKAPSSKLARAIKLATEEKEKEEA
mmetsp:Transcript_17961/g.35992  ORF Transcript_17961/g.35992 Transcript_17961/m.35992 type:complete len:218 (-) Transcript_17961:89-742(-)